jgi:ABC-2 type transport system ATP-binding protein
VREHHQLAVTASVMSGLDHGEAEIDEATRRVSVGVEPGGGLTGAIRSIEDAGVAIDDITLRQPTLDEVFLALTGQPTAETDVVAAPSATS